MLLAVVSLVITSGLLLLFFLNFPFSVRLWSNQHQVLNVTHLINCHLCTFICHV